MSNADIVNGIYDAFGRGDVPGVLSTFDPMIRWTEAAGFMYGGTYIGPDAVLENVFMRIATEWDGFRVTPGQIVDGGDTVVVLGAYTGRYKATDRDADVPFAHAWTLRDGRVTEFQQYTDTLVFAKSIGLI